jgi:hypothetical protein
MTPANGPRLRFAGLGLVIVAALLTSVAATAPASASRPAWHSARGVDEAVDLAGPRSDGRLVVATTGGSGGLLSLWTPLGSLSPFARGAGGYSSASGEPYIDVASGRVFRHRHCSFGRDSVYAIDQSATPGVVRVSRKGITSRFAELPVGSVPEGITFDRVGGFGYRLLVADRVGGSTTVFGIDCRGRLRSFARGAPGVEGGIRVAPHGFGRFGGDLIMPDELSGNIYATSPSGTTRLVVNAGTPAGGDVGVESLGFVPRTFDRRRFGAFVASAHGDSNFGPGSKSILTLTPAALRRTGIGAGDLLGVSELAATTVAIHCTRRCTPRTVAEGPAAGHIEGHVVFAPAAGG